MEKLWKELKQKPVIGAIRGKQWKKLKEELTFCSTYFLLEGDIGDLQALCHKFTSSPFLFLHIDLFAGLAADESGLVFLKKNFPAIDGIISTRARTLTLAKKVGFQTIFRLFLLDSESLKTGLKVAATVSPTAIEILPGIIFPAIANSIPIDVLPPLICGGFVSREEQVASILQKGALAVSTSKVTLWRLNQRGIKDVS